MLGVGPKLANMHGRLMRREPPRPPIVAGAREVRSSIARLRSPRRFSAGCVSQRGIALIAVLWLTVLLTVIASGFAFSMRGGALAARNTMSVAQARAAADGAIERVAFELSRPRNTPDVWLPDGRTRAWADGEIAIASTAVDESALIDLNLAADPLLKGLLQNVGGLDSDIAEHVLEAILDWRDPSGLRRPNGAGPDDYRAAGLKYVPTNARFESVGELRRVLGVTPELMARIAGSLTVYSQQRGINAATAPRDSLLALPGVTPDQVDAFIASRTEALANQLPVPAFPPAQAYAANSPVWRIHVEATTPDGVTFARDAVIRPQNNPRQPMTVLLWQEGEAVLRSAAIANPTPTNGTSKS